VLPAIRCDHRRIDGDLGVQLLDAEPGPDSPAVAAAPQGNGAAATARGVPASRRLAGLGIRGAAPRTSSGRIAVAKRHSVLFVLGSAVSHGAWRCNSRLVAEPRAEPAAGHLLPAL